MVRPCLLLFLMLPLSHAAQQGVTERILEDRLPERFFIDVEALRGEILARVPPSPQIPGFPMERRNARRNMRFADREAFGISELLTSGYVYSDWNELEEHVNAILRKVIPPDFPDGNRVHAYLVRDAAFNARMTSSGYMFINIGLFSELYDESSLAAVMCHELAHFHLDHGFKKFYGYDVGAYEGDLGEIQASKESVRMEVQADSLALHWMLASEYDMLGMHELLNVLDRLERRRQRMRGDQRSRSRPTHPGAQDRLAAFRSFYEKHQEVKGASFLVDREAFARLRMACWPEILRVQLQGMDFSECIRTAFNYHIFQPEEPLYVWYLMEAIRRACYLDVDRWDKNFIMDEFYAASPEPGKLDPERATSHLFESFDTDVMCLAPQMYKHIQARFYWKEDLKFITYREAYDFFQQLGELLGCNECRLSMALCNYNDQKVRDSILTVYLQGPARHEVFALDMLQNKVRSGFGPGKLLVFTGLHAYIRQGRDRIPVRVGDDLEHSQFARFADSLTVKLPGRRVVSLPDEKKRSLDRYLKLTELEYFAAYPTFAKGERTELHVLDPRYYELFKVEEVDEIEFVYCDYGELREKERTAEAYEETATTDLKNIFEQTSGLRYLDVYVSSLREVPKSPMKVRYSSGEYAMKNKRTGLDEMVTTIKQSISGKEERLRLMLIYVYK